MSHGRSRLVAAATASTVFAVFILTAMPAVSNDIAALKAKFRRPADIPFPKDNPYTPEKAALGKALYFDPRLSGDSSTSCASCHVPQLGWTHIDALARGYPGHRLWRNNPTVLNAAHYTRLMWDGTLDSLEVQARSAMQAPVEGNGKASMVAMRLRLIPEYVALFHQAFGTEWPQLDHAWQAIAAFERTLVSDPQQVPFDRHHAGDKAALSEAARRGLALFEGKAGCIRCHHGALASDEGFHALGVPRQPLYDAHPLVQIAVRWQNGQRSLTAFPAISRRRRKCLRFPQAVWPWAFPLRGRRGGPRGGGRDSLRRGHAGVRRRT